MMNGSPVVRFLAAVGRTLGKAVVAGVGMEMAKIAGSHLQKRLAARDAPPRDTARADQAPPASAADTERMREENARLRAEVDALRQEVAGLREGPPDAGEDRG